MQAFYVEEGFGLSVAPSLSVTYVCNVKPLVQGQILNERNVDIVLTEIMKVTCLMPWLFAV